MATWKFSADTGGTFTDCILDGGAGKVLRCKVLSSGQLRTRVLDKGGPRRLRLAPMALPGPLDWLLGREVMIEGRRRACVCGIEQGGWLELDEDVHEVSPGVVVEFESGLEAPVLGLRILLTELGEPLPRLSLRIGTTRSTNALLENKVAPAALFVTQGFADILLIRDQKRPDIFARQILRPEPLYRQVYEIPGRLDCTGGELVPLDQDALREAAANARAVGCEVAAVCLMHAWVNPDHERAAARILEPFGFSHISLSSSIRPLIKYLDRTETTLVNAALCPVMDDYLDGIASAVDNAPLWIMGSFGGLVSRSRFHPVDSLVSGPAGGLLGAVAAGRRAGMNRIIALDMGGTSTDVSRCKDSFELRQQVQVGTARLLLPCMPIETVAAGGGSICSYDGERLLVGPASAGATPGPAAYGAGGPLTLTDLHLLLGRLDPAAFSIPVDVQAAKQQLLKLATQVGESDVGSLAEGLLQIATERMAQAIRGVSLREGEDPADYAMVAFGGAGGLHACRVAQLLGMRTVILPAEAGLLSARGIHDAAREVVVDNQYICALGEGTAALKDQFASLLQDAVEQLSADGVAEDALQSPECTAFVRMRGQEGALALPWSPACDLQSEFKSRFVAIFGYYPRKRELEISQLRLLLREKMPEPELERFSDSVDEISPRRRIRSVVQDATFAELPSYDRELLSPGALIRGPAVVYDRFSTCFVESGWTACLGTAGSLKLLQAAIDSQPITSADPDHVEHTLVYNRLDSLVVEMGEQIKRTALSTNIRERLDFSCALLDASGRLLVNAPHIPVHLGALGLCVRECAKRFDFQPGDVLVTNHPAYGGSHLPDVTLICGLFNADGGLLGYLANRAHHAEIGGRSPGSMPADARLLEEEGVVIAPQWLVRSGAENFATVEDLLRNAAWPSRNPQENLADLAAQAASLRRGSDLFADLLKAYGSDKVLHHLASIYSHGADAMRAVLQSGKQLDGEACVQLDDGHKVVVAIRHDKNGLCVDFTGTSPQHPGNLNATPAIVRSALLYVLRLLVDTTMPLNEGLLDLVRIQLPDCFLNPCFNDQPRDCPAVVGGNVESSQKIVEALLRAFQLMAASQGTMNNLLFGNSSFGYYETIGGGAGAGPGFHGASGVHVHMTNTAITDPEILEQRFPVLCNEFSLRRGSGGSGRWNGGDGLIRELQFKSPVSLSLLMQSRIVPPAGIDGGTNGSPGQQWLIHPDRTRRPLPGSCQLHLRSGDCIRIETPGGGGCGEGGQPLDFGIIQSALKAHA